MSLLTTNCRLNPVLLVVLIAIFLCYHHGSMYFIEAALLTSAGTCASSMPRTSTCRTKPFILEQHNAQLFETNPSIFIGTRKSCSLTRLFATPTPPSQRRVARRDLKKRPNRRGRRTGTSIPSSTTTTSSSSSSNKSNINVVSNILSSTSTINNKNNNIVESEIRPLVRAKKIEAGEDYWIDEKDLQKNIQRQIAIKNRKSQEGEISKEKLRVEVAAPYKQNWIGLLSVGVIVLATIIRNFPELLNSPVIQIPDL